jgi:ABC-2 type transport system ATP-binding protein
MANDQMTHVTQTVQTAAKLMLQTEALTRRFGMLTAVDALTLSINAGEVFGLLGPSGAGKSTVIKMLAALLPPTAGSTHVVGFDIVRQAAQVQRVIGYVLQPLSADGALTGYENLLVFAKLYELSHHERDKRIHEALAFMDLADVADHLVKTYSVA